MDAIRIETLLSGDTLYLPQLKPLLGKSVEIIVRESSQPAVSPARSNWDDVRAAVLSLEDYNLDAYQAARTIDVQRQSELAGQ